jgi:hypothetical protein
MSSRLYRSTSFRSRAAIALFAAAAACAPAASQAQERASASPKEPSGFFEVIRYSLAGDVYDPARWRELGLTTFFTDGWDEAWASGPNGEGGAPRQGWLNAADGVFYRLFLFTFNWAHLDSNDSYVGGLTGYTPLNRRFQFRFDIPFFVSVPDSDRETGFGDFQVTPRFLLSETVNFTQSLDLTFRTPTGSERTGNGIGAFSPAYNFWWNAVAGFVLRGSVGGFVPFSGPNTRESFLANLAAGYYFTPHDMIPIGDLVWYVSTNLNQLTDGEIAGTQVPNNTTLTFTPGFRTHLGANFYLLGGVEVPATHPKPFDYQVLAALMKVW